MSESEAVVEGGRPEWLPDKFATPEAFGKSYTELESKMTQLAQQNKEQAEQFEAYLSEEQGAESPPRMDRGQTLASIQRLTEEAAFRSAKQVVDAIASKRVPAPEDPDMLASVASQMMPTMDAAWTATDSRLLAGVLESRPELLSEERLGDMQSVVSDLSTAAALARGVQSEQTLERYRRAESIRDAKRNAQTLSGTTGKGAPADDDADFFDRIKGAYTTYSSLRGNP